MDASDVERRLAVQEALVSALITHAANRGMIADMIHEARARLAYPMGGEEKAVREGVLSQLETILNDFDNRPIAIRPR